MYTGALPPTSIHGTWHEQLEVRNPEDDQLCDMSIMDEIILVLRDREGMVDEVTLSKSNGDITTPSLGIIEWEAKREALATLQIRMYEVILTVQKDDFVLPLILGNISIVE